MKIRYGFRQVGDVEVFYREAGSSDAPVILLLHGFPTASHMFRDLIPLLADRFRLVAPDLPGFGQTKAPPRGTFDYTFDRLADVIEGFVNALSLDQYVLYIFDYGAPVGLRLAMRHSERISAIVSQNGNAYIEGFSDEWGPWESYWREPSAANREACRPSLAPDTIRNWQYGTGADPNLLSPDGYELDIAYMGRSGAEEIQLDLILDYRSNVALYPVFHSYFREHRPPLLAVWGRYDPAFLPAGATAYQRDLPDAKIHLLDAGHFALETHAEEVATLIRTFLDRDKNTPSIYTGETLMSYITVGQENSANIDIYYEDLGTGQPVVLIHGFPLNGHSWEKQVLVLLNAGYRVITYDRRGFGASSQPSFGYDYDTFAADLNALMTKLDLQNAVLVGFSMGTGEVTRYLGKYGSERVQKAVLMAPVPPFLLKTDENPEGVDQSVFDGIMKAIVDDRPAYFSAFFKEFFNVDVLLGDRISNEAIQASWNVAAGASAKATLDCVPSWLTDFRDDLPRIDVPTLIIHGDADRILPLESTAARLPKLITNSQLVVIPGGPHAINWTHADRVNPLLLDFLKKN